MARVFISYRRADVDDAISRLRQALQTQFGEDNVFYDRASLRPGDVFPHQIRTRVRNCQVLLAVVGREWTGASSEGDSGSRLDDANDFVRLEVEAAFEHRVKVMPVLVGGATLPPPGSLPPTLWPLLERQAHEIRPEHLDDDISSLIAALNRDFRLIPWEP